METHRLPKEEEQHDSEASTLINSNELSGDNLRSCPSGDTDATEDLEGIFGITDEDNFSGGDLCSHGFTWDFWAEAEAEEEDEEEGGQEEEEETRARKDSNLGSWDSAIQDYEEKQFCLKLNLNYQEVIDAWSERQSHLWTDASSAPTHGFYAGEVPVMEEERNTRREASVLRYKEKRQNRLFSKKIRYQVRKLNADNRPRLKGRFVKRE
ncbi:PREDICTED: zinc finger protein CONSTANS-LIKE 8 [Tarenaya hassleriana]|uniref:zinc finger protein CONSTANS-LIKE 8 n=1 Tax=Tarenaya hassleriana TaxID=28532 RepID=UPI00053C5323|nr:PREDICTED: zinc finger protein CONSTANS-LIKE 8 [Tarenaya hassleriana]